MSVGHRAMAGDIVPQLRAQAVSLHKPLDYDLTTAALEASSVTERFVTRGFIGRRGTPGDPAARTANRLPPGQYITNGFPVLSAGPTEHTPLDRWSFSIEGLVREPARWSWDEFMALTARDWTVDISCVTKWTKLDMPWRGVSVDTLLEHVDLQPDAAFVVAWSDGGYTTNLPLADVVNGQAFVAFEYDSAPLTAEHGGPARLVVPARYFWKSAKWVRGLRILDHDEPGFWESFGYHNRGDQWLEERYSGD
jgi:DMSO/TMAO reductase YedYZ molybdopterin-dependent catalytic subunit